MRIISGIYRGRIISAPKNFSVRPTTDLAKEGLFNILQNEIDFETASVLDLFAGIGSISFESASRGVADIISIERNSQHANFIKQTAKALGISQMHVLPQDVRDFLKIAHRSFDLIFADPPYDLPWIAQIPDYIFSSKAVTEDSTVIIEHPAEIDYSQHSNYSHTRKYGKVHFSWFYLNTDESE